MFEISIRMLFFETSVIKFGKKSDDFVVSGTSFPLIIISDLKTFALPSNSQLPLRIPYFKAVREDQFHFSGNLH